MPDSTSKAGSGEVAEAEAELRQVNFRLPEPVLDGLRRLADRDGVSLPQLVANEMTGYFLRERKALKDSLAEQVERARLQEEQLERDIARAERQHEAYAKRRAGGSPGAKRR